MSETVVPFDLTRSRRAARRVKPVMPAGTPLTALPESWRLAPEASNKASYTIYLHTRTASADQF